MELIPRYFEPSIHIDALIKSFTQHFSHELSIEI